MLCNNWQSSFVSIFVSFSVFFFFWLAFRYVFDFVIVLQLAASPWTTEASTKERWQYGALTNRKATSNNRAHSLSSLYYYCCDRKSRAACAQSFAPWQQATIEFTCHDHSIIACSCLIYVWFWSSRTSRSWRITQSTQHHRRGCNTTRLHYHYIGIRELR